MHELISETIYDEPPSRAWTDHISWGAMLALGWLIYEVTARPSFGIAVVCGKFGWNDFLTAHWLLRTDPDRNRGRTCFWFYVANGLWKVTVAAFIATGTLLILMVALNDNAPRGLVGVGITAAIGITLLAVIPLIGVLHARGYGVRVWVDASVHASRLANHWPPQATGMNAIMGLLFPSLMVPIVVTAVATFPLGIVPMLASLFGEGIFIWWLFRGVCADSPAECWAPFEFGDLVEPEATSPSIHEPH